MVVGLHQCEDVVVCQNTFHEPIAEETGTTLVSEVMLCLLQCEFIAGFHADMVFMAFLHVKTSKNCL